MASTSRAACSVGNCGSSAGAGAASSIARIAGQWVCMAHCRGFPRSSARRRGRPLAMQYPYAPRPRRRRPPCPGPPKSAMRSNACSSRRRSPRCRSAPASRWRDGPAACRSSTASTPPASPRAPRASATRPTAALLRRRRLYVLLDHVDLYWNRWRDDAWLFRRLDVEGEWPCDGMPFVAVFFHWGYGLTAMLPLDPAATVRGWSAGRSPEMCWRGDLGNCATRGLDMRLRRRPGAAR